MSVHLKRVRLRSETFPVDDRYPFDLEVLRATPALDFTTPVTLFVGENGTGKSTLLEAIARRCGIHIWEAEARRRVEHNPYEERLWRHLDLEWTDGVVPGSFFASQIFRHFVVMLDDLAVSDPGQLRYFADRSLLTRSHGQSLMAFFRTRYRRRGLYLLDEPETALSPRTQVRLARLLAEEAGRGEAQFIVATHSPILLATPGGRVLSFEHVPVAEVDYRATDHWRLYRAFLTHPEAALAGEVDPEPGEDG